MLEIFTSVLAAICGPDNIALNFNAETIDRCKTCPSFTGNREEKGVEIEQVIYGSFTAPGMDEAVVDLSGCEGHVNNWGGSILLRSDRQHWSMVRYEPGVRSLDCLNFSHDGINSLVCENGYINQGYVANWLDKLEFPENTIATTQLISVTSNSGSCRPPLYEVEIVETQSQDINNDGLSDLLVVVSEAQEAMTENESEDFRCDANLPNPTIHQLTFLFDGQSFTATPETLEMIEYLQSIGR